MGRGNVSHWLHEHHILPEVHWRLDWVGMVDFLKATWLIVVLLVLGIMALITAVLIAWPALSYLGSRLFG
jgi:hypothetical protein